MGISQDIRRRSMLAEHVENLLRRAALLGACVELAIRVGTCPTLAKAVVALAVHLLRTGYLCQVALTLVYILATLHHDGTQAQFDEPQGCKQSARTSPHHYHLTPLGHIRIMYTLILVVMGLLVDVGAHLQINEDGTLAGIDATTQDAQGCQRAHVEALSLGHILAQGTLVGCYMGLDTYLILFNHGLLLACKEVVDLGNLVLVEPLRQSLTGLGLNIGVDIGPHLL